MIEMTEAELELFRLLIKLALARDVLWLPAILIALRNDGIAARPEQVA